MGSSEDTKKVLRASSAVVEDKNGNTIGMVTMLNDITRQKELERMQSDFLGNVTHELRTPLIAVEKSLSLMLHKEAGDISATQEQFLSIADRNLKRLTFLINDLLDLTKFEAGRMELKPQKTDMASSSRTASRRWGRGPRRRTSSSNAGWTGTCRRPGSTRTG